MTSLKAPAEKLPLVARKNIRDAWEAKKPEYEANIHTALGEPWKIEVNPNLIYQYADDDRKNRLGDVLTWYFDAFVYNLKNFAELYGSDGVQELNATCSKRTVVFAPQETTEFRYGGLLIDNGALRLVFAHDCLATNVDDISRDFSTALKNAPVSSHNSSPYNLIARNAVQKDFNPEIESVRKAIADLVNMPNLTLNGNFEANAAQLAQWNKTKDEEWEKRFGYMALEYFKSLKYHLERHNFKGDDMQQEAFQEAIEMGQVCFRILKEWEDGVRRYNDLKIEEGVLYIQTTAENWGVNVDDAATSILDIL